MEIQLAPESAPEEEDASADTPAGLWFPLVVRSGYSTQLKLISVKTGVEINGL